MVRVVIAFLVVSATATTYLAYRNLSRVTPLSDNDRSLYDDL
jgi:hypothetical protein